MSRNTMALFSPAAAAADAVSDSSDSGKRNLVGALGGIVPALLSSGKKKKKDKKGV